MLLPRRGIWLQALLALLIFGHIGMAHPASNATSTFESASNTGFNNGFNNSDTEMFARLRQGAQLFQQRCAICHGSDGLGEGVLAMSIPNYPNTNLLLPRVATDSSSIRRVIVEGPLFADISPFMPPWKDAMTDAEIEAATLFVVYLRQDLTTAIVFAREAARLMPPSARIGRALFLGRCAICHGADSMGSGRLAARLQPKPSNLANSRVEDAYLRSIISLGGAAVLRSPAMPAWDSEFSESEIESIIFYLHTLRKTRQELSSETR